jgi:glutamyl-Q tRNA(Asp) synthetase
LHLGHAYAAWVAWDLARRNGGTFLLRHEDIDATRVREIFYQEIENDLRWLGLHWDGEPLRQVSRRGEHDAALERLRQRGLAYPCFCTRREIQQEWERMGAAPHGFDAPPYPGTCKTLAKTVQDERISRGEPHSWRIDAGKALAETGPLTFTDARFGTRRVDGSFGDVILARKDIGPAYHLAVVIDDAAQGVTHITRGEDLLDATPIHRVLQALLEIPEPQYFHHSLVTDENGKRLAKRDEARSIHALREAGHSAAEVLAMARVHGSLSL